VVRGSAWAAKKGDFLIPKQEAVGSSPITRSSGDLAS
jgi:hypothetical protein